MELYTDDRMLQLSGIQHYTFCPRQWALIHIEQMWDDNRLTAEGTMLHSNVDNPFRRETNGSPVVTLRGFRLVSATLGLSGVADALELHPSPDAPTRKSDLLNSKMYEAIPIEYKRGRRKTNDCDRIQVVAQAMIIEEMLGIDIKRGAIFYWEERQREYFEIFDSMRSEVKQTVKIMHRLFDKHILPKAHKNRSCRSCSLIDICMPSLTSKSARKYISDTIDTMTSLDEEIT